MIIGSKTQSNVFKFIQSIIRISKTFTENYSQLITKIRTSIYKNVLLRSHKFKLINAMIDFFEDLMLIIQNILNFIFIIINIYKLLFHFYNR